MTKRISAPEQNGPAVNAVWTPQADAQAAEMKKNKQVLILALGEARNRNLEASNAADLVSVLTDRYGVPVVKLPPMRLYEERVRKVPLLKSPMNDLEASLRDVRREVSGARIWIAGLGMAGALTARLLGDLRKCEHLEGVILCDPHAYHPDAWRATTQRKFGKILFRSDSWKQSREFDAFGGFSGRKVLITSPTRNMDKREIFSRYGAKLGLRDQYLELSSTAHSIDSLLDLQTTHELAHAMGACITNTQTEAEFVDKFRSPTFSFA